LVAGRKTREEPSTGRDPITAVYRGIWSAAAAELGADCEDTRDGLLAIRKNGTEVHLRRKADNINDPESVAVADDKTRVHELLRAAGLSTPDHVEFGLDDLRAAVSFLAGHDGACVVKPTTGEGGYGVTCGVRSQDQLIRAAIRASRLSPRIAIEHEVDGDFYRFLVFDGEILSIVRRHPPSVIGDGRSSIEELIFAENRARAAARTALPGIRVDFDCVAKLDASGLSLSSVIPDGLVVTVKSVVSQNAPRENEIVREDVAADLRTEIVKAADVLDLRLAGIDVMTTTLMAPLGVSGGAILEVNGAPGLTYHYEVADESDIDAVAVPLLREMLANHAPSARALETIPGRTGR
jgi:cyanophycin synthetase